MHASMHGISGRAIAGSVPGGGVVTDVVVGTVCVLLCFFLNPFLVLFVLAAIAVYWRVPESAFFVAVPVAFSLFFYFREYGVDWAFSSSDDVPNYVFLYQQNALIDFFGIIPRYFGEPGTGEPLWHMLWWPLINLFDASDETFIFLHYALIF